MFLDPGLRTDSESEFDGTLALTSTTTGLRCERHRIWFLSSINFRAEREPRPREIRRSSRFTTFFDQPEKALFDSAEKGRRFERLMVSYFRTDPAYAEVYDRGWL